ncbi:hypothetical protein Godav_002921, partial [Gossypium davidsonii]|nr:hypothetical protein [Gossypium davidsonii]
MEEFITSLSIGDEEEETIYLGMESSDQEISFANCFMGSFLASRVVNFQAMRTTLALLNRPVECNEVYKLECSGFREASDNSPFRYVLRDINPSMNEIDVYLDGRSGVFSMGWNSTCKVSLRLLSRRHIDIMVDEDFERKTDFNEISYSSEKNGELVRSERKMRGFRDALVDCSLTDL